MGPTVKASTGWAGERQLLKFKVVPHWQAAQSSWVMRGRYLCGVHADIAPGRDWLSMPQRCGVFCSAALGSGVLVCRQRDEGDLERADPPGRWSALHWRCACAWLPAQPQQSPAGRKLSVGLLCCRGFSQQAHAVELSGLQQPDSADNTPQLLGRQNCCRPTRPKRMPMRCMLLQASAWSR